MWLCGFQGTVSSPFPRSCGPAWGLRTPLTEASPKVDNWRGCWSQDGWQNVLSLWDRHGRMLLLKDRPAAEEGEGSRCEGKIQVTTWALQRYRRLWRREKSKLASGSMCRGETWVWAVEMAAFKDFWPSACQLGIRFLDGGGGGGKGWKRQMPREIIDLATRQKATVAGTQGREGQSGVAHRCNPKGWVPEFQLLESSLRWPLLLTGENNPYSNKRKKSEI